MLPAAAPHRTAPHRTVSCRVVSCRVVSRRVARDWVTPRAPKASHRCARDRARDNTACPAPFHALDLAPPLPAHIARLGRRACRNH